MEINLSLGSSFPTRNPFVAMESARCASDPVLGPIGSTHVQICPQNGPMKIDEETIEALREKHPETTFRLHANARLLDRPIPFDFGNLDSHPEYRQALVRMLRFMGVPCSLHAAGGKNPPSGMKQIGRCLALEDEAGVPVAIEGLYPQASTVFSSWEDYELFLNHDVRFALDLSHLNIVRNVTGIAPDGLVQALVASPNCIEVHLSGNDGSRDFHGILDEDVWWLPILDQVNPESVIFYEGRQRTF